MGAGRRVWAAAAAAAAVATCPLAAHGAYAAGPGACSGSFAKPGVIQPGTYDSMTVQGFCIIPGGTVTVLGNLVIAGGGTLLADFPGPRESDAEVTVTGNALVGPGAALVLGCSPSFGCRATTHDRVGGSVGATGALGVLLHADQVQGSVVESGGGGGQTCTPTGVFQVVGTPVFSTVEDSTVGGEVAVTGLASCWLGLERDHIGGSLTLVDNRLADPNAIEVLANSIAGNLVCVGNSAVWDSVEQTGSLYPRVPEPNTVGGVRAGQCRLASPTTAGGEPGPGPF